MVVVAAVDLGAQSGRVAEVAFDGSRVSLTERHRFANVPVRDGARLHWDILRLYRDVLDGLRATAGHAPNLASIGVDSWAIDFGLLDGAGELVGNPVHYRDRRRAEAVDDVLARVPRSELYRRTGIQHLPINTIFELAAMVQSRDPALEIADTLLLIPDLINHWLCGATTSELTNATTTQCFDPIRNGWATDILERLGIDPELMPGVVAPGTALGSLHDDVAAEIGSRAPTVVATATHDTGSAVAGTPLRWPASAYISAGTWSLVGIEAAAPVISDASYDANLTNEGGVGGTFRVLHNVTGLWLVHECRRHWAAEGKELSFDQLVDLAADAPPFAALIDPNHASFAESGDMPRAIRDYCSATRQAAPEEPGAVVRCILESLALKHADVVDVLGQVTGRPPTDVSIVGGGARNELLCRWTANASGLPVLVGPEEATLLGNALVQLMALGEIRSYDEAREVVRASVQPVTVEPSEHEQWGEARDRFAQVTAQAGVEAVA
jgi:rhamnulokinase